MVGHVRSGGWALILGLTVMLGDAATAQAPANAQVEPAGEGGQALADAAASEATPPDGATEDAPHSEAEPPVGSDPVETAAALDRCNAQLDKLAGAVARLQAGCTPASDTSAVERLNAELGECRADERQNRLSLIEINNRLEACESRTPVEDPRIQLLEDEKARLTDDLIAAEKEIERLSNRLTDGGMTITPGFAYAGGSVDASFVRRDRLGTLVPRELRLPTSRCPDALAWLDGQTGKELWLLRKIWVWDGAEPRVCSATASGPRVLAPSFSDEAHAVIFR